MRERIKKRCKSTREALIRELEAECNTIALSLDGWISQNNIAIISIIGYWISPDFKLQYQVLEFGEIKGKL